MMHIISQETCHVTSWSVQRHLFWFFFISPMDNQNNFILLQKKNPISLHSYHTVFNKTLFHPIFIWDQNFVKKLNWYSRIILKRKILKTSIKMTDIKGNQSSMQAVVLCLEQDILDKFSHLPPGLTIIPHYTIIYWTRITVFFLKRIQQFHLILKFFLY